MLLSLVLYWHGPLSRNCGRHNFNHVCYREASTIHLPRAKQETRAYGMIRLIVMSEQ